MTIGERLREERLRLGLSQTDLGAAGGVGKNTQINYEKGERSPDASYLAAAAGQGLDVLYVVTGVRTPQASESISADEAQLVERYRQMTAEGRAALNNVSGALASYKG